MADIRGESPEAEVLVGATDEQRVGLQPVTRRVWTPHGQRPLACGRQRYEWQWVFGFVEPTSGRTWFWLWSAFDSETFALTLHALAAELDLGPARHLVLQLDGAGQHQALALSPERLPVGLHLVTQPSCSPELQPSERLWTLTNEAVANRVFEDLAELTVPLAERCRQISAQPETVRALTCYDWWARAVGNALACN